MAEIDFASIEKKWQDRWDAGKVFEVNEDSNKEKFYALEMFPYPSGEGLHMGHALNYTIGDILARYKRMKGFNVLHPMGFDSLGLPAENAAIKAGTHPSEYTKKAIGNFILQQKGLGVSYDWTRMVNSADPAYYKWDQWIFLKMLEKGLAYQKEASVNWCSKCNTVLANEQVHDGFCWRHEDCEVEVRKLTQWFFRTREYAQELLDGHEGLDWPERTVLMQKNWIGRSEGAEIEFSVENSEMSGCRGVGVSDNKWKVFTTRPDTIFGVTFMVVASGHDRLDELVTKEQRGAVDKYLASVHSVSEKDIETREKEGVFTGSYAINPANGEKVPIWAGNFVLADYGSGMVMGVPAHDQRDFDFAKKYGIPIRQVVCDGVSGCRGVGMLDEHGLEEAYTGGGILIDSGEFDALDNVEAKEKIVEWLEGKDLAKSVVNYKLRDWGVSRQRYWGTPIPIIHCEACGAVAVPEKDLPVELPKDVKFGEGNPLETNEEWLKAACPKCGEVGRRESDTMDTFVNSSWYFLRYTDANNDSEIFSKDKVKYWSPVDVYIGGAEHACMHLLYARFYTKVLRDVGVLDFDEPFTKLFHQGLLHAEDGRKMSKSWGNVIEPLETMKKYGVDATRWFLVSVASPDKDFDWSENGISSAKKFIKKVINFFNRSMMDGGRWTGTDNDKLARKINLAVKNIGGYYDNFDYRRATIEIRELFSEMSDGCSKDTALKFLKLIAPIAPHVAEELWDKFRESGVGGRELEEFISVASWPDYDEEKILERKGEVDLNGKIVSRIKDIAKDDTKKAYVYVMPFEIGKVSEGEILRGIGDLGLGVSEVRVFAVNDSKKVDPEGRAKRAKPGMAAIYLE